MKNQGAFIVILLFLLSAGTFSQTVTPDIKGSKDHPLISRMPDFWISEYKESEFDSYKFIGADKKPLIIEGHKYSYGVASLAPVASNDTEEGKAKNRRVELVKQ